MVLVHHLRNFIVTAICIAVLCYFLVYSHFDERLFSNLIMRIKLHRNASKFAIGKVQWNITDGIKWDESERNKEMKAKLAKKLAQATDKKIILRWYAPWNTPDPVSLDSKVCGNCEVTYDRSKINNNNTGAVEFHYLEISRDSMPSLKTRNYGQLYVFSSWEGPPYMRGASHKTLEFEDEYGFNATMTYRRTADFYAPFGNLRDMKFFDNLDHILKLKTKTAVAVVSNCDATPGAKIRKKLLDDIIRSGFKLEAFGRCFKQQLVRNDFDKFINNLKQYKFYFSYENSYHCEDYMTEKFYRNALLSFAIPVVWGPPRKDYEAVAPKNSFISSDDFNSPEELLAYLNYLDKNDTAYLEYFRWHLLKPTDMPQYDRQVAFCSLCRAIHGINVDDMYNPKYNKSNLPRPLFSSSIAQRIVPSVRKFFYEEGNKDCLNL